MKNNSLILLVILLIIIPLPAGSVSENIDTMKLTPTEKHHVIELNSNQPYVAGYHVNTLDLETRETVRATSITVSFPSTNTSYFPSGSWLGGGMFVQGQESRARGARKHVDYAFYTMLVLDAEGDLFLDLGMHQTREETPPFHTPTKELIYAYTWQISEIDPATPITLSAMWDPEGWIHYLVSASGSNITLPPINVADNPCCKPIIRKFYAGNRVVMPFPFSRYVHYFQFGIVSPESIANNHWSVDLRNPRLLRETGWTLVDTAWSIQGDISYLDGSLMWGGLPYHGVSAQYYQNPLENPYEIIFFYNHQTLSSGTVLWQCKNPNFSIAARIDDIAIPQGNLQLSTAYIGLILLLATAITTMIYARKRSQNWHACIDFCAS